MCYLIVKKSTAFSLATIFIWLTLDTSILNLIICFLLNVSQNHHN